MQPQSNRVYKRVTDVDDDAENDDDDNHVGCYVRMKMYAYACAFGIAAQLQRCAPLTDIGANTCVRTGN